MTPKKSETFSAEQPSKSVFEALSEERIRALESLPSQCRVAIYPTLASTNETVRSLAAEGEPAGLAVFAERQTAGRGRMGRSFFSPAGSGIYMTLLLRPQIPPQRLYEITTFAAVATAKAMERSVGISANIKWVNDLWIGQKKVCGILAEAALQPDGKRLRYVALGIGINVKETAFPTELSQIATSLEAECGRRLDRNSIAAALLAELTPLLSDSLPGGFLDEYRRRNFILGHNVTVVAGDRTFEAVADRIEDDGNLIVILPGGREERICAGDVSLRPIFPFAKS